MKPRHWMAVGFVSLLLLFLSLLLVEQGNETGGDTKTIVKAEESKAASPRVGDKKELSSLSEKELLDLLDVTTSTRERSACVIDKVVEPGELIVTEGYLSGTGEYIFSALTPTHAKNAEGKEIFSVAVERFTLRAGGDIKLLYSLVMPVNPGFASGSTFTAREQVERETIVRLEMRVENEPGGKLKVRAKEFDPIYAQDRTIVNDPGYEPR